MSLLSLLKSRRRIDYREPPRKQFSVYVKEFINRVSKEKRLNPHVEGKRGENLTAENAPMQIRCKMHYFNNELTHFVKFSPLSWGLTLKYLGVFLEARKEEINNQE